MKKILLAVTSLALLASNAASAADLAVKTPPVAVTPNDWAGFYLGGHAGYAWGHDPFREALTDQPLGLTTPFPGLGPAAGPVISGVNSRGWAAGGYAGYNLQRRAWVGGIEADFSASDITGSNSNTALFVTRTIPIGQTLTSTDLASMSDKFSLFGSVRGRLGMLVTPNFLLYGTGGLGWTRYQQTFFNSYLLVSPPPGGPGTLSSSMINSTTAWRYGWVAGAGGEYKVFDGWLLRLEYMHYDFGDSGTQQPLAVAPTALGARATIKSLTSGDLTLDIVRAGLGYKF